MMESIISDELFESTHERKFLGFHLVEKILSQVSADEVSVISLVKVNEGSTFYIIDLDKTIIKIKTDVTIFSVLLKYK